MYFADFARQAPRGAALLIALALAACGGSSSDPGAGGGSGGGTDPTLVTLATSATALTTGATSTITATVTGPGATSGVSWALTGSGSLSNATTTSVTYTAPASLTGAETIGVTARSVADNTAGANSFIVVNGTPVLASPTLFPLNQNVAFGAQFAVAGGTAPFTWAIASGTLPTGLAFGTSTTNSNNITGTPTAIGSSTFTISATDSVGRVVSNSVTLTVRAQTACLLEGNFAFGFAGFRGPDFIARGGNLNVATDGKITGVEDLADIGTSSLASTLTAGTCRTAAQNYGTNETASPSGNATYAYAALNNLNTVFFHESDATSARGSGELTNVTVPVTAAPTGTFAFGLFGVDTTGDGLAVVGRATLDATGTITAGRVDVAGPGAQTAAALTGNFGAPGTANRGTATLTFAGRTLTVYFYPAGPDRFYALSAAANAPRLAGFITRQTGLGATASAAFARAGILSAWGAPLGAEQITALGRMSLAGTNNVNLVLDTSRKGDAPRTDTYNGMNVTLDADGRAVVVSTDATRRFVIYFDGVANGYVAETTGIAKFGLLESQSSGPYQALQSGTFVSSTQFGNRTTNMLLAPQLTLSNGLISGPLTGSYVFDVTTGRAATTVSLEYFGGTGVVIYLVNNNRLRIMGSGQRGLTAVGSAISVAQR